MAVTPTDIFASLPGLLIPENADGVRATFQFDLIGEKGGQWYVTVTDGAATVHRGTAPSSDVTISMADWYFVGMILGTPGMPMAFMTHLTKFRVTGDGNLVLKFHTLFRPFRP